MIRIVVVDDHPVVRQGLTAMLRWEPEIELVGEAADGRRPCSSSCGTGPTWCFSTCGCRA
jgi:YesN/AraC family two-component response regulator